jgi:hypothetical protein
MVLVAGDTRRDIRASDQEFPQEPLEQSLLDARLKYVMLIYQAKDYNPQSLSADEHKAVADRYGAVNQTPNVKPGLPLGFVNDAITVRVRDGQTVTPAAPTSSTRAAQ